MQISKCANTLSINLFSTSRTKFPANTFYWIIILKFTINTIKLINTFWTILTTFLTLSLIINKLSWKTLLNTSRSRSCISISTTYAIKRLILASITWYITLNTRWTTSKCIKRTDLNTIVIIRIIIIFANNARRCRILTTLTYWITL